MRKNGFTIIEVIVLFLLILGVTFLVLPMALKTTKQANLISDWTETYAEIQYIFSVINAQEETLILDKFKKAPNNKEREEIILTTIRPYLRVKSGVDNSIYQVHYKNGSPINAKDKYFVDNFYETENGRVIGLKWIVDDCNEKVICGFMTFDVNGIKPPNNWGDDVFGINVYKNSIEPIGKEVDINTMKNDCNKYGTGIYCSYYYLIGGDFE